MVIFNFYYKFQKFLLIMLFILLTMVVTYQLLSRNISLLLRVESTEELARYLFICVVFVGASIGVKNDDHFVIDLFSPQSILNKYLNILSIVIIGLTSIIL